MSFDIDSHVLIQVTPELCYGILTSPFILDQFSGDSTTLHVGEVHTICPSNNTALHSHAHVNYTAHAIQSLNDAKYTPESGQITLIVDDLPPMFEFFWNKRTVPLFLLILFPIVSLRSVTIFTKINAIG